MPGDGLQAALLDSGGVLIQPAGGRWNPRADFEQTVLAHDPGVPADRFAAAIAAGDRFLDACATTPDRDDYHRAMLAVLGVAATPALLADLQRPVEPSALLETFPEVAGTLAELRRHRARLPRACALPLARRAGTPGRAGHLSTR